MSTQATNVIITEEDSSQQVDPRCNLRPKKASEFATDLMMNSILGARAAAPGTKKYRVKWTGSKIPRGVEIPGLGTIAWTQHGRVLTGEGEDIGTYQRVREFAGDSGDEHEMLIVTRPGESH